MLIGRYPAKGLNAMEKVGLLYTVLTTILIAMMWGTLHHPIWMMGWRVGYVVVTLTMVNIFQRYFHISEPSLFIVPS